MATLPGMRQVVRKQGEAEVSTASDELEAIIGPELMQQVCDAFPGEVIYIPARPRVDAATVRSVFSEMLPAATTVMSAYQGTAERCGISARTVRRLVSG